MTVLLRGILILVSSGTTFYILRKIKQSKVQIEDSVFWIIFSVSLIVISIFPDIAVRMSQLLGISSPVNFLFLFIIFVLLMKLFYMTIRISLLENKVKDLTQKMAIEENLNKKKE